MNWLSAPLVTLTYIQFEKDLGTITSRHGVQKEEEFVVCLEIHSGVLEGRMKKRPETSKCVAGDSRNFFKLRSEYKNVFEIQVTYCGNCSVKTVIKNLRNFCVSACKQFVLTL